MSEHPCQEFAPCHTTHPRDQCWQKERKVAEAVEAVASGM